MYHLAIAIIALLVVSMTAVADDKPAVPPGYEAVRINLPSPIYDAHKDWIDLYWKSWALMYSHIQHGTPENGFAPNYLDEAFNPNIFQWDTCFMCMFARYGNGLYPVGPSLDDFYGKQHADGFICREIRESDGSDFHAVTSDQSINPPLFAWVEWETYIVTGDKTRLPIILPHLVKYFDWIKANRRRANGLYWTSNLGSGMDNSPRVADGWVDLTAQQALAALSIARIAGEIGETATASRFEKEYKDLADLLNSKCWDPQDSYYYDLDAAGHYSKVKTVATFWPLLAEVVNPGQIDLLTAHLSNPSEFNRIHRVPTLSADHPKYDPKGGYWLGSVWAPTNYAIVKGLDAVGQRDLAREIVVSHLTNMSKVFVDTKTIWENYAPESMAQGNSARGDFVGWSGVGPIAMLIEDAIGIEVDARKNTVTWYMVEPDHHGIERLNMGANTISLVASKVDKKGERQIETDAQKPFRLVVERGANRLAFDVPIGTSTIKLPKQ